MAEETSNQATHDAEAAKASRLEAEREAILTAVANVRLTTMLHRVAWLLNHLPETRDSDLRLQIQYWTTFESDIYAGGPIAVADLFRLTRLTSLARARATIQNGHKLFLATEAVRKRRGTLQEEERQAQRDARAEASVHSFTVYVDESGKTGEQLIVGSCWLLNGIESLNFAQEFSDWRAQSGFDDELHFVDIGRGNVHRYYEALEIFHRRAAAISFKAVTIPRGGLANVEEALREMLFHLLIRGVRHETQQGRAPLPRTLQVIKDADNRAQDALTLANIKEQLLQASEAQFDGELRVGELLAVDSKANEFLQFADLFVGSANRILNAQTPPGDHPKDQFAISFMERFGLSRNGETLDIGDVVHFEDI